MITHPLPNIGDDLRGAPILAVRRCPEPHLCYAVTLREGHYVTHIVNLASGEDLPAVLYVDQEDARALFQHVWTPRALTKGSTFYNAAGDKIGVAVWSGERDDRNMMVNWEVFDLSDHSLGMVRYMTGVRRLLEGGAA